MNTLLLRAVLRGGEVSPLTYRVIRSRGRAAVPALVKLLLLAIAHRRFALSFDPRLGTRAGRWAPIHAVDLLVDLRACDAIVPMLDVLVGTPILSVIHERITSRLPELGAPVLEPALQRFGDTSTTEVRVSLGAILGRLRIRDERVFAALYDLFPEEPVLTSAMLADYGDERALPLLARAIGAFDPASDEIDPMRALGMMASSYECIAGTLPPDLDSRVESLAIRCRARDAGGSSTLH